MGLELLPVFFLDLYKLTRVIDALRVLVSDGFLFFFNLDFESRFHLLCGFGDFVLGLEL